MPESFAPLRCDPQQTAESIQAQLTTWLQNHLHRKGYVLGLSGGIDSSVCAALAARAVGPQRVVGVLMPEQVTGSRSLELGKQVAECLKIQTRVEPIGPALEAVSFQKRYNSAVQSVISEYDCNWKSKIVLNKPTTSSAMSFFNLVAQDPHGKQVSKRLTSRAYLQIVAATNFKQRIRKMFEYYWADALHYAVIGTPNRLEFDQGFFVKNGDGAADAKPIAHLYKTQVYQLAEYLDLPEQILQATPTTDTYSIEQSQEEFYFAAPLFLLDACMYAMDEHIEVAQVSTAMGCTEQQIRMIQKDIARKRTATRYLHTPALTLIG